MSVLRKGDLKHNLYGPVDPPKPNKTAAAAAMEDCPADRQPASKKGKKKGRKERESKEAKAAGKDQKAAAADEQAGD